MSSSSSSGNALDPLTPCLADVDVAPTQGYAEKLYSLQAAGRRQRNPHLLSPGADFLCLSLPRPSYIDCRHSPTPAFGIQAKHTEVSKKKLEETATAIDAQLAQAQAEHWKVRERARKLAP
jgi:hypothetical protein